MGSMCVSAGAGFTLVAVLVPVGAVTLGHAAARGAARTGIALYPLAVTALFLASGGVPRFGCDRGQGNVRRPR